MKSLFRVLAALFPRGNPLRAAGSLGVLVMTPILVAQTFTVSDPTRSGVGGTYYWTPLLSAGTTGYLTDSQSDQQTGQKADDFVGTSTNPGFMMRYGQIGGVDSVAFRVVLDELYTDNKGKPAFGGQVSIGMDSDGDGSIDIVFSAIGKNQDNGISYQIPDGSKANVSPSTTSIGNPVMIDTFKAGNMSYQAADSTIYPGYTQVGSTPDAVLTFAISFANINTALAAAGQAAITPTTLVRFIAYTATQTSAINQDAYGAVGIVAGTRFDAPGGGFTEFTDSTGKPIPEPSTWLFTGVSMATALAWMRRQKTARRAAGAAGSPDPGVARRGQGPWNRS